MRKEMKGEMRDKESEKKRKKKVSVMRDRR